MWLYLLPIVLLFVVGLRSMYRNGRLFYAALLIAGVLSLFWVWGVYFSGDLHSEPPRGPPSGY
jgi:membrane protease YdiL (CAAX protease family)